MISLSEAFKLTLKPCLPTIRLRQIIREGDCPIWWEYKTCRNDVEVAWPPMTLAEVREKVDIETAIVHYIRPYFKTYEDWGEAFLTGFEYPI